MKDSAFDNWLKAVYAYAQTHLMGIPVYQATSSDPIDYYNLAFWSQVPPSPINIQSNTRTQADINAATFFRHASDAQKEEMARCQRQALEKLIADILAIKDDVFTRLCELESEYRIAPSKLGHGRGRVVISSQFFPKKLFLFILHHPSLFASARSLEPITRIDTILSQVVLESRDINKPIDFFWRLNNYFAKEYNAHAMPGLFQRFMIDQFHETFDKIIDGLRAVYCPDTSKIMATPIDPDSIREVSDIRSVFAEESARFGAKGSREIGGRAGWGAQKPDLWKP
ncbi:MAG: hypothetical protein J0L77_03930 [Alphaproteobacteria bacterium]|nr:hypothetical protein [Alphaproteobacteria bacterium]